MEHSHKDSYHTYIETNKTLTLNIKNFSVL